MAVVRGVKFFIMVPSLRLVNYVYNTSMILEAADDQNWKGGYDVNMG